VALISIDEIEHRWKESTELIALLVLLEYDYPRVVESIKGTKIEDANLSDLVSYALDFETRYWAEKALTWIESGYPVDPAICAILLRISESDSDSQKLRHRSLKQAKRWQRTSAT
jgi:hypothetical protein